MRAAFSNFILTLSLLCQTFAKFQAFQSKLMSADSTAVSESNTNEQEKVCDIHGIPNCESCFDTFGPQGDEETDEGWMAHKLVSSNRLTR